MLQGRVFQCKIASGREFLGQSVFIPRVTLYASQATWGFTWKRRQFPFRLAFALTINKAQSLSRVGVWLERPCFSHGQFYVAASRCGHPDNIKLFVHRTVEGRPTSTKNVVYREIFD